MITLKQKQQLKNILIVLTGFYLTGAVGFAINHTLSAMAHAEKTTVSKEPATSKPPASKTPPSKMETPPPLLQPGVAAPGFSLPSFDGPTVSLSDFKGKRDVLLEFFATWCPHCQHSVPILNKIDGKFPGKLRVIAINVGDPPKKPSTSAAFMAQYKVTYPILERADNLLIRAYHVNGVPALYLVDKSGVIRWNHVGTLEEKDIAAITDILKKP